jgi:hypothetical protein
MVRRVTLGLGVLTFAGCWGAPPHAEVDLIHEPWTLSQTPRLFAAAEPLRADGDCVRLCVYPGSGYHVSGHWTVVTPKGREALVIGRAELANGRIITLASPSATGNRLCVQPRLGGPLETSVRRVSVATTTPIVVDRIVWESSAREAEED